VSLRYFPDFSREVYPIKKTNILLLITSALLVAGVTIAWCTQDSGSASRQSSDSSGSSAVQTLATSVSGEMNLYDHPAFNQSGVPGGTHIWYHDERNTAIRSTAWRPDERDISLRDVPPGSQV
jgi:hypothetical protein